MTHTVILHRNLLLTSGLRRVLACRSHRRQKGDRQWRELTRSRLRTAPLSVSSTSSSAQLGAVSKGAPASVVLQPSCARGGRTSTPHATRMHPCPHYVARLSQPPLRPLARPPPSPLPSSPQPVCPAIYLSVMGGSPHDQTASPVPHTCPLSPLTLCALLHPPPQSLGETLTGGDRRGLLTGQSQHELSPPSLRRAVPRVPCGARSGSASRRCSIGHIREATRGVGARVELMLDGMPSGSSSHLANGSSSHYLINESGPARERARPRRVYVLCT